MTRNRSWLFAGIACLLAIGAGGCAKPPATVGRQDSAPLAEAPDSAALEARITRTPGNVELISKPYDIDRPYLPLLGPKSSTEFRLLDDDPPELVWITGGARADGRRRCQPAGV